MLQMAEVRLCQLEKTESRRIAASSYALCSNPFMEDTTRVLKDELVKSVNEGPRRYSEEEKREIERALLFALKNHEGDQRLNGEPYVNHSIRVARRLVALGLDAPAVVAAVLHDLPDYTRVTPKDIEKTFGGEITRLVEAVSRLRQVKLGEDREEAKLENLRRMFLAMAKDLRVVLIKLAGRLDNMETIEGLPPEERIKYARETLEIYAPIASRLGIGTWKGTLEDLAFPYVYPEEYKTLQELVGEKIKKKQGFVEKVKRALLVALSESRVKVIAADSRVKHLYSLWRKLMRYEGNLERVRDLVALRIIVPDVSDCYAALGTLHKLWRPVPGSFDDYIANPKPNGYQSLHTDVFALNDEIVEIQIRTPEMHQEAEFGVGAHWYYEAVKHELAEQRRGSVIPKQKLIWMQELTRALQTGDADALRLDFFQDRIFVFTPKGDVVDLPVGATPVDFAYHIHTDVGNTCIGAKADGKIVSLDYQLKTGEIIEILTQKNKKPSVSWLEFVKTSVAREHIRQALKKE